MRFIQETGFTIKPDKNTALQAWFIANQGRFAAAYPPGCSFIGAFATVFTSEKGAGELHILEQLDSYAALDRIAAAGKDPESEYARLFGEFTNFVDPSPGAGWSSVLLKDVADVTVWDFVPDQTAERGSAG